MNRPFLAAALGASSIAIAIPMSANATTWVEVDHICPIGGEEFTALEVASNSYFGSRPDGKPYGALSIIPITECPGNGLPLFKDFDEAELAILETAITAPEFIDMRTSQTPRFRVAWLMEQLSAAPADIAYQLLVATWESDSNADQKIQYQTDFVARATGLDRASNDDGTWLNLNARAVNALRELGQFDEALALLHHIGQAEFLPEDEETRTGYLSYFADLRTLIGEGNISLEPATMIPQDIALLRCAIAQPALTASELPICNSDEVQEGIADFEVRDEEDRELRGLEALQYIQARRLADDT